MQQGNNKIVGKSIMEAGIRTNYGITVLAIKRGSEYVTDITRETVVLQDDILYIFGQPDNIIRINKYFKIMS